LSFFFKKKIKKIKKDKERTARKSHSLPYIVNNFQLEIIVSIPRFPSKSGGVLTMMLNTDIIHSCTSLRIKFPTGSPSQPPREVHHHPILSHLFGTSF